MRGKGYRRDPGISPRASLPSDLANTLVSAHPQTCSCLNRQGLLELHIPEPVSCKSSLLGQQRQQEKVRASIFHLHSRGQVQRVQHSLSRQRVAFLLSRGSGAYACLSHYPRRGALSWWFLF